MTQPQHTDLGPQCCQAAVLADPVQGEDTCWPVHTPIRYYVDAYGQIDEKGPELMMNEIYARGPITCRCAARGAGARLGPCSTQALHLRACSPLRSCLSPTPQPPPPPQPP